MSIIGLIVLGTFLDYIFFIYKRFAKKEFFAKMNDNER